LLEETASLASLAFVESIVHLLAYRKNPWSCMSFRLVLGVGVLFKEQDSEYGKFSWLVKNVNSSDEKVQKGLWNENHKWE
jgi:hypothetical protein